LSYEEAELLDWIRQEVLGCTNEEDDEGFLLDGVLVTPFWFVLGG